MKKHLLLFLFCGTLFSENTDQIRTLFFSLKSNSIKENLAFYSLFPDSPFGKKAIERGIDLINRHREEPLNYSILKNWPEVSMTNLISSIGNKMNTPHSLLSESDAILIKTLSSHLKHHQLAGHTCHTFEEMALLKEEEIDLARAIFLFQFQNDVKKVEHYEAALDLMALEILAKLPKNASIKETLNAMHELIFFEMEFRFPPHSLWAKDVDIYTFLPSVMDDRFGVCLGVSILYLGLGQRLGLSFNIFTPPGHIFIQAKLEDETVINIETTARGIHIPMENYLGINGLYLKKRTIKETVGLSLMNFAATFWEGKKYQEALDIYLKAKTYLESDPLLHYFIALNALFCKNEKLAKEAFSIYLEHMTKEIIKPMTLLEDYYDKHVDIDGLKAIFASVDEKRSSIIEKQKELINILNKYPSFKEGHFHLGITYLQLSQLAKAKTCFESYHALDPSNPTVEYYLALLCIHRLDYKKAYIHLTQAEKILSSHGKSTKILRPTRLELLKVTCTH